MKTKAIFIVAFIIVSSLFAQGQNSGVKMNDEQRICLTPYISEKLEMPKASSKILTTKMNQVLTKNGLGGTKNQRFIFTAKVDVLDTKVTTTIPVMQLYTLAITFYIGDGIEGTLFSSTSVEAEGMGETTTEAYNEALQAINVKDKSFQEFLNEGKQKIVEYYNSKCDFIIQEAQTLAQQQEFDYAIYKLTGVPDVCKECYDKCMSAVQPIFQQKIDLGGEKLLAEARAIWNAGLDMYAAEQASDILAMINPSSKAYSGAVKLSQEIAKRVAEIDKREWNRLLKQEQDAVDLRKAEIKAIRDIGVAYGEHQQPTTYNVRWW